MTLICVSIDKDESFTSRRMVKTSFVENLKPRNIHISLCLWSSNCDDLNECKVSCVSLSDTHNIFSKRHLSASCVKRTCISHHDHCCVLCNRWRGATTILERVILATYYIICPSQKSFLYHQLWCTWPYLNFCALKM